MRHQDLLNFICATFIGVIVKIFYCILLVSYWNDDSFSTYNIKESMNKMKHIKMRYNMNKNYNQIQENEKDGRK